MKTTRPEIDEFISSLSGWQLAMCKTFRAAIHECIPDGYEDWKWGPNFKNKNGVMVIGLWAFAKHVNLIFFQGSEVQDKYKLFNHGAENKYNRMIKFFAPDDLTPVKLKQIKEYIRAAAKLERMKLDKPVKKKLTVPKDFKSALAESGLLDNFNSLTYSKRKDHLEQILGAKQAETRERRIKRSLEKVKKGLGYY